MAEKKIHKFEISAEFPVEQGDSLTTLNYDKVAELAGAAMEAALEGTTEVKVVGTRYIKPRKARKVTKKEDKQ